MPHLSLDAGIFIAFLLLNLVVGLAYGRKVKTLRDYAVGNKKFSTSTIAGTIVATTVSGSGFVLYVSDTYREGLSDILSYGIGSVAGFLTTGMLAVRVGEFMEKLSVSEAIGSIYGRSVRLISAILGLIPSIGKVAMQFKVSAMLLSLLFNLHTTSATVISAGIVIVYSAFGGIRSVTFTDLIQFLIFAVFVPVLTITIFTSLDTPLASVTGTLTSHPVFSFRAVFGQPVKIFYLICNFSYFAIPSLTPYTFQRIMLSKDVYQVQRSFTWAAMVWALILGLFIFIAILLLTVNPNLEPSKLVVYMISHYTYAGFRGLFAAGVMAMVMSTADSIINSGSILVANDITRALPYSPKHPLVIARVSSLFIGLLGLTLAIKQYGLMDILVLTHSFYMPIVTVPLLLAIYGFRSSTRVALIGMGAGFVTVILWRNVSLLSDTGINSVIPGMLANCLLLLGSHYVLGEPGGWVGIKEITPLLLARQKRGWQQRQLQHRVHRFQPWRYLIQHLPRNGSHYFFLGFYLLATNFVAFFFLPEERGVSPAVLQPLLYSTLVLTSVWVTYPLWRTPGKHRRALSVGWYGSIFLLLFVSMPFLVLAGGFSSLQLAIYVTHLFVAIYLLPWPLVAVMVGTGLFFLGAIASHLGLPWAGGLSWTTLQFPMLYATLLLVGLIFLLLQQKRKTLSVAASYQKLERAERKVVSALYRLELQPHRFVQHLHRSNAQVFQAAEEMSQALVADIERMALADVDKQALLGQAQALEKKIEESNRHLAKVVDIITHGQVLKKRKKAVKAFLDELQAQLSEKHPDTLLIDYAAAPTLQADTEKLTDVLLATLSHMKLEGNEKSPCYCYVYDAKLRYDSQNGRELPAIAFVLTTQRAAEGSLAAWPQTFPHKDAPLDPFAERLTRKQREVIVALHYGYLREKKRPLAYTMVVPQQLRDIRPSLVEDNLPRPSLSPEQAWQAKLTEAAFWQAVGQKGTYHLATIEKAVAFMRQTHAHQRRQSGEPFFTHPLMVAIKVAGWSNSQDTLLAALLHDTVEDTNVSAEEIGLLFGERVRELVVILSNLKSGFKKFNLERLRENAKLLEHSGDAEGILVKLCDRWHNLETLDAMPLHKRVAKAGDTLRVYVPLARQVGFPAVAEALEELCEKHL